MDLLPDTQNWGLHMRRECQKHFPHHRLQRKPLVSDIDMHHGICVTHGMCMMHVPWCMSESSFCGGGENVPGIPSAYATHNFGYLIRDPWPDYEVSFVSFFFLEKWPCFKEFWLLCYRGPCHNRTQLCYWDNAIQSLIWQLIYYTCRQLS